VKHVMRGFVSHQRDAMLDDHVEDHLEDADGHIPNPVQAPGLAVIPKENGARNDEGGAKKIEAEPEQVLGGMHDGPSSQCLGVEQSGFH
jgi:hypothetical protein